MLLVVLGTIRGVDLLVVSAIQGCAGSDSSYISVSSACLCVHVSEGRATHIHKELHIPLGQSRQYESCGSSAFTQNLSAKLCKPVALFICDLEHNCCETI